MLWLAKDGISTAALKMHKDTGCTSTSLGVGITFLLRHVHCLVLNIGCFVSLILLPQGSSCKPFPPQPVPMASQHNVMTTGLVHFVSVHRDHCNVGETSDADVATGNQSMLISSIVLNGCSELRVPHELVVPPSSFPLPSHKDLKFPQKKTDFWKVLHEWDLDKKQEKKHRWKKNQP